MVIINKNERAACCVQAAFFYFAVTKAGQTRLIYRKAVDAVEFEQVYRQYAQEVYLFVFKLCAQAHTAEEITQETFVRAYQAYDRFEGRCRVDVWLCQIAKNLWFSHYRRRAKWQALPIALTAQEDLPSQQIEQKETVRALCQALHQLPKNYQEVFALRVFGELSFQKIGALFGKNDSWARVTYYRAKTKLQQRMKEADQ